MADHPRSADRRALVTGVVAAAVLCLGWLLPSASHAGDEGPGVPQSENEAPSPSTHQTPTGTGTGTGTE